MNYKMPRTKYSLYLMRGVWWLFWIALIVSYWVLSVDDNGNLSLFNLLMCALIAFLSSVMGSFCQEICYVEDELEEE